MTAKNKKRILDTGHFLERWDFVWSVPLSIFVYWFFGYFCGAIMGMSVGSFDLSFVQPLFLAVTIVIGASTAALYVFRFHFKTLFNFIYSSKRHPGDFSSTEAFKQLTAWQKMLLVGSLYLALFVAVVVVYLRIV